MLFNHSYPPLTSSEFLQPYVNCLSSLHEGMEKNQCLTGQSHYIFPFFFPLFQEADQVLAELCEAGICDFAGNPFEKFNFIEIPPLRFKSREFRNTFLAFENFLDTQRCLETSPLEEEKDWYQLDVPVNFRHLFRHLIQISQYPLQGQFQQLLPPVPIVDIQLIGSHVLCLLKYAPIQYACREFFGSLIKRDKIKAWFQMKHIKQPLAKSGNDYDIRILNPGVLNYQAYLSNVTLNYLASSMPRFNYPFFFEKLKQKHVKYHNIQQIPDPLFAKQSALLEFGGITKRKLVNLPGTKYAILGIKTRNDKPTDLLFVGLKKNNQPELENVNLSTTNCWTVSIFNQLVNQKKDWTLRIQTGSFSAAKALIDLLCGISTIPDPNVDAWIRFIRDNMRSMQPDIESKMVENIFKNRTDCLKMKQSPQFKQSGRPKNVQQISNGKYLYYLLKEEILKNHFDHQTQTFNSLTLISFLFRACQSMQKHSTFSDQDCATLWHLADAKGWLQIQKSDEAPLLLLGIKKALVEEKVPFSIVSAWMSILAWNWAPHSATSHCQQPVFQLKSHMPCLLPIQPIDQGNMIQGYLTHHALPVSFQLLFQGMIFEQKACNPSPLIPHLPKLGIEPSTLQNLAEKWLTHSSPLINSIGWQFYLGIAAHHPNQWLFALNFQRLPLLLHKIPIQQATENLKALNQLAELASPGHSQALQQVIQQQPYLPLTNHQWISILTQTRDPKILVLAYTLWKENENRSHSFVRQHLALGHTLYRELCAYHPHLALLLLQILPRNLKNDDDYEIDNIIHLLIGYQTQDAKQLILDLDFVLVFIYPLFEREQSLKFKSPYQKRAFSQALAFLIEMLYQAPCKEIMGDNFLLDASRKGYLDKKWQTQTLLNRINKIHENPNRAFIIASIFQIFIEEDLLDPMIGEKMVLQKLRIQIGESLLCNEQEQLSLDLYHQMSREVLESESLISFYEWTLHLFQKQAQHPIEDFQIQLLDLLLLATPADKVIESEGVLFKFFQQLINHLKKDPLDPKLVPFDQFLGNKKLIPFMNQTGKEWKELIIDYLEASVSFTPDKRLPEKWLIYEQLFYLFNKTQNSRHLLRLLKLFASSIELASSTSHTPTLNLLNLIKNNHENILTRLLKNSCPQEAKIFLLALNFYHIPHQSLAPHLSCLLQEELEASDGPFASVELLDLVSFDNLKTHIQPSQYCHLPRITSGILRQHSPKPLNALPWINWCIDLQEDKIIFSHSELMEEGLTCAALLLDCKHFKLFIDLFTRLSNLSETQLKQANLLWVQMAANSYATSSIEMNRQIFLNPKLHTCKTVKTELQPLVLDLIGCQSSSPSGKSFIFDLLKHYAIKDAGAWKIFWDCVSVAEDKHLIVEGWEIFKIEADSLSGAELTIAQCWTSAFSYLHKFDHPDLLTYFHHVEWLEKFENPCTSDLKWKALEFVFLKTIHSLSPQSIDTQLLDCISKKKLDFYQRLPCKQTTDQEASEIAAAKHWNRKIEHALIEHLASSSDPEGLLRACRFLDESFKSAPNEKQFLNPYMVQYEKTALSYLALNTSAIPPLQDLEEMLSTIADSISQLEAVSPTCYLPLIHAFLQKPTESRIRMTQKWIEKILNQNTIQAIEALKSSFIVYIPLLIQSEDQDRFINAQKYLERSFALMGLSLKEKCSLSHLLFTQWCSYRLKTESIEGQLYDTSIKEIVELFVKWSPYFFAQPYTLKKTLGEIAPIIKTYANIDLEDRSDQNKFSYYITQILDIKYRVKLANAPSYRESMHNYHAWVIGILRSAKVNPIHLLESLAAYGNKLIDQTTTQQLEDLEFIAFFNEFVRLYPPQPLLWTENKIGNNILIRWSHPPLEAHSQRLLKKAYLQGVFSKPGNLTELVALEIWTNRSFSKIIIGKRERYLLEKTIQEFLAFNTPYSISRAIQTCRLLQNADMNSNEYKILLPIYQNIANAIRLHAKCYVQNDKSSCEPLFGFLCQQTLLQIPQTQTTQRQIVAVANLYFQSVTNLLNTVINDQTDAIYQAYYLSWCFRLLRLKASNGAFENNFSAYLTILRGFLPFVKSIAIKREYDLKKEIPLANQMATLANEWVDLLIHQEHFKKDLTPIVIKERDKQLQRTLLFEGLTYLSTLEQDDVSSNLYNNIVMALLCILDYKKPTYGYWINANQPDAAKLFESIKQSLSLCESGPQMQLAYELVNHQFYFEAEERNHLNYVKSATAVNELFPKISIQANFPFANFTQRLLSIVVDAPKQISEIPASQKKGLFLNFFTMMIPVFEKTSNLFLDDGHFLLIQMLEKGIEKNLMQEDDPLSVNYFEWSKKWLSESPYAPIVELLGFFFYKGKMDDPYFIQNILNLIPSLAAYIVTHDAFKYSDQFVDFITKSTIADHQQFTLFIQWTDILLKADPLNTNPALRLHLKKLTEKVREEHIFDNVNVVLDISK